jgi:hypothetical protein
MAEYDELLEEVHNIGNAHRSKARQYIPKMYWALRNENPNHTPEGARVRIEKDCVDIWSKRTILDALPDEAKDQKKQRAGRLSQKEANSAAVSAAPLSTKKKKQEEIIIDTEGNPIENSDSPPPSAPLTTTTLPPIVDVSSSGNNRSQFQNNDDDLWHLEYTFPLEYVSDIIFPFVFGKNNREYSICFEGVFDRRTRKVVSATLAGRIPPLPPQPEQQESTVK